MRDAARFGELLHGIDDGLVQGESKARTTWSTVERLDLLAPRAG